jgi:hypothetical protein
MAATILKSWGGGSVLSTHTAMTTCAAQPVLSMFIVAGDNSIYHMFTHDTGLTTWQPGTSGEVYTKIDGPIYGNVTATVDASNRHHLFGRNLRSKCQHLWVR